MKAQFGKDRVLPPQRSLSISTANNPNHSIKLDNTKILAVELKWFERGVKESIYNRKVQRSFAYL